MRGSVAAGAGRQCAPAAPIGRGRAAPQLHSLRTSPLCQQLMEFWFVDCTDAVEREGQTASL
jgi:hypothetical protein